MAAPASARVKRVARNRKVPRLGANTMIRDAVVTGTASAHRLHTGEREMIPAVTRRVHTDRGCETVQVGETMTSLQVYSQGGSRRLTKRIAVLDIDNDVIQGYSDRC